MTTSPDLRIAVEFEGLGDARQTLMVTTAQLHGRTCVMDETHAGPLGGIGHVYTADGEGGRHGWPVVGCPLHWGTERLEPASRICSYCGHPGDDVMVSRRPGDRTSPRVAVDHPLCYQQHMAALRGGS